MGNQQQIKKLNIQLFNLPATSSKKLNQGICLSAVIATIFYSPLVSAQSIISEPNTTGTIVNQQGNLINISGGTQAGGNLFHSFTQLGLQPQEIANFLSQPGINNILGRVTGGDISVIEGLIRVSGSNANLFLMNPAGIIFGTNARLDVPGNFTATTANGIGFADGWFQAFGDNEYENLTGSPNSFTFNNDKPEAIINKGNLNAANLNLIGGTVVNQGNLSAPGNITIAAVPGGKTVRLSQEGMILGLELPAEEVAKGINPLDLPALLTAPVEGIGEVNPGDTIIMGSVVANTVNLGAASRVKLGSNGEIITGNSQFSAPTVTIFPESETDPLAYIFLDVTVPDYETFLYSGKPGTTTVVVTPEESGIGVISDRLAVVSEAGQKVDEVHIVSEGNQSNFWLGKDFVSSENIEQYQTQFASWDKALGVGADILIYACLAALGDTGETLLNKVAAYTGADVAGSTNLTGAESLGADWLLEMSVGDVEATTPWLMEAVDNYNDTLQIFTVANNNDNGAGSLREAIASANGNTEADEIRFNPSFFNGSQDVILLTSGELEITAAEDLKIDGAFGGVVNVVVDGNDASRVFNITSSGDVTFESLTIQNGNATGNGGGISNTGGGTLMISNSNVYGNSATLEGGGIFNSGDNSNIIISNSTVSGNRAINGSGGGIRSFSRDGSGSNVTVINSTISGNSASFGGGISSYRRGSNGNVTVTNSTISGNSAILEGGGISSYRRDSNSNVTVTNSTISGNSANEKGGGIRSFSRDGSGSNVTVTNSTISGNNASFGGGISSFSNNSNSNVTVTNSTISGNNASFGGGIYQASSSNINIFNTIIAGNEGTLPDVSGNFNDQGNNLISISDGSTGFTTSTLVGTSASPIDPKLTPLSNYGGTTQTHALLPGSPAINTGSNDNAPTTDQRGVNRGTIDIGAFEVSTDLAISKTVDNPNPNVGETLTFTITLNNNGTDAVGSVSLNDTLPAGLTFVSANTNNGSYDRNTGVWSIGSVDGSLNLLTAGTNATLNIIATVNQDSQGTLTNTANNLSFAGEDTNISNNQASVDTIVIPALDNILIPPTEKTQELSSPLVNPKNHVLTTNFVELESIEKSFTTTFTNYLGITEVSISNLQQAQDTLTTIAAQTDIKPALIYAVFAPTSSDFYGETQDSPLKQQVSKTKEQRLRKTIWQFSQQSFHSAQEPIKLSQKPSQGNYQLELILVTSTGEIIHRPIVGTSKAEVIKQTEKFRSSVADSSRLAYTQFAQQFYQWLVAPLDAKLQEQGIDNLVFILDEGLRSIPLAAMMDGNQFIIEKYSVGLMPSLSLTDTSHVDVKHLKVLAMGAEIFTEQSALPAVPKELSLITNQLWSGKSYLNQEFTLENLKQARKETPYGIIHLATHGKFELGKPSNSYIQLWDRKLSLDSLRTFGWNNPSVELLVLSACRTAIGNREAELGFAGLAVQTGVKSALGSLWAVSDEGTLGLMSNFYQQLKTAPIKAEALRQAQLSMLREEVYLEDGQLISGEYKTPLPKALADLGDQYLSHPYYWSGFTIIGNPW